jgi:predicted dehydrogenase
MNFDDGDTFGHTPLSRAFGGDVYGIGFDAARAGRRPVRLGMIGAGGVAQSKYFPAVARLQMLWEPIAITAFVEPRSDHAAKIASVYGGRPCASVAELLSEPLDGVLVLSPDALHAEHTIACLEAGLPVLVEKPIARTLSDAQAMCEAAEVRGLALMTVANKRFSPPYRRARQMIERGVLPKPGLFTGKFTLGYDDVDLLEAGTIHLFDLALFVMGGVRAVSATGVPGRGRYPIQHVAAALAFASGAAGTLVTSSAALSLKPWERVEVFGDHVWLSVEDQLRLTLYDSETGGAQVWEPIVPNTLLFDEEFGGYMGLVEHFVQVIRGIDVPTLTGWDGCRAFELLTAVKLALVERTWIDLPLDAQLADAVAARWLAGL